MTLLKNEPAPAPAGNPAPGSTPPSSGEAKPVPEAKAAGKETPPAETTPPEGAKPKVDNAEGTAKPKEGEKPSEKKAEGAPEAYKLRPTENGLSLGPEAEKAFVEVARELNLSNDAAQKIVDRMAGNIATVVNRWAEETKADPVIGGANLAKSVNEANRGLDLRPPALRQTLEASGMANHKEIISLLADYARLAGSETKPVSGDDGTAKPKKSAIDRLAASYENSN